MGMFDQEFKPFSDHFKEGEAFQLTGLRVGPMIPTEYGRGTPVILEIEGDEYSAFGEGLLNQARNQVDGDLPRRVKMERRPTSTEGQAVKLLVPADGA